MIRLLTPAITRDVIFVVFNKYSIPVVAQAMALDFPMPVCQCLTEGFETWSSAAPPT